MSKINSQLDRMKAMMTYGLQNESKKSVYDSVEYQREGADGKLYGIVREGTKFYIKVSDKTKGALKEDFNYIGGFRNRKDNEYTSYANALKQFDIKMISLKEAKGNTKLMVESWNPENNEKLMVEATASMQREIARQRQIMGNAATIFESKNTNYSVNLINEAEKPQTGDATSACGDPYTQAPKDGEDSEGVKATQNNNIGKPEEPKLGSTSKATAKKEAKVVKESEQVLGWNDNADYLDTSHGTEVGDDAPFTEGEGTEKELKNGTVAEGVAMHTQGENQNSPAVGTGEIGDDAPFTDKAKNELQECGVYTEAEDVEGDEFGAEDDFEGDDLGVEDDFGAEDDFGGEEDFEDEDLGAEEDFESGLEDEEPMESDTVSREEFNELMNLVQAIADKVGATSFDDDELYDDSEDMEGEDDFGAEEDFEGDDFGAEDDFGGEEDFEGEEDDFEVYESRNYRKMMMKEDKLDYFGKHPAYQKEPMELPSNSHNEMPDYYDMNDDSVKNEKPYGQQIGDSAPFEIDPQAIENAIAESIKRILGNKKKI